LGIQGKRKTVQKRVTPGIGAGSQQTGVTYPIFTYEGVDPGFAEHDLDEYDAVADAIAWSRSLDMVRKGFGAEVNLEKVWDENEERAYNRLKADTWTFTNTTQRNTAAKASTNFSRPLRKNLHPSQTSHPQ
jgi:hypothetical protein